MLFKLGYKNATTLDSIIALMRQNNMTEANSTNQEDIDKCSGDVSCVLSERGYWSVVGVRGDITSLYKEAYGVIDTKIVFGKLTPSMFVLSLKVNPLLINRDINNPEHLRVISKPNIIFIYRYP